MAAPLSNPQIDPGFNVTPNPTAMPQQQQALPTITNAAPAVPTAQPGGNLSKFTQATGSSTTALPSWYCTAQQSLVKGAQTAANAAPTLCQTVAQGAINTLSGPANPFTAATNTLGSIASGAANPWITGACGAVTPNTQTALGGLFAAQQNQLNQLLPSLTTPTQAAAIGSGNFGSLRACTAVDTAKANALANLQAQQMCAALKNQATGVNAGIGMGNVGQEGINTAMNVGQQQMVSPFTPIANAANIINATTPGATVSTVQTPSTLNQLGAAGSLLQGGLAGACNLLQTLGVKCGIKGLVRGSSGGLCCASLKQGACGYYYSKCGNLIVCKNDQSGQYSGCLNTPSGNTTVCYGSLGPAYNPTAGWSC